MYRYDINKGKEAGDPASEPKKRRKTKKKLYVRARPVRRERDPKPWNPKAWIAALEARAYLAATLRAALNDAERHQARLELDIADDKLRRIQAAAGFDRAIAEPFLTKIQASGLTTLGELGVPAPYFEAIERSPVRQPDEKSGEYDWQAEALRVGLPTARAQIKKGGRPGTTAGTLTTPAYRAIAKEFWERDREHKRKGKRK